MKKLAIEGHETRNEEVIKLLEMLGGKNPKRFWGNTCGNSPIYYYIKSGEILCSTSLEDNYKVYTLEEFFQKFPFKVGDKVRIPEYESQVKIVAMKYFNIESTVDVEHVSYAVYCDDEEEWYTEEDLLAYNDIEDYKSRYTKSKDSAVISSRTLGIKGNSNRSEDVKLLLIMLGGRIDMEDLPFDDDNFVLYIGNNKCVYPASVSSFNGVIYSLEKFEEKFPYKTGDLVKCWVKGQYGIFKIEQMYWYNLLGMTTVRYVIHSMHFYPEDLKPYETNKEQLDCSNTASINNETTKCKTYGSDSDICKLDIRKENTDVEYTLPEGFQFVNDKGEVIDTTKVILKRIKPKYPKTYEKCCDVLLISPYYNLNYITYEHGHYKHATSNILLPLQNKLNTLGKLLICRDAYWKIAGEEMGLDKPWNPDFSDDSTKYNIFSYENEIILNDNNWSNRVLVFPTKEIRDAFYENFKDLIEKCKELL